MCVYEREENNRVGIIFVLNFKPNATTKRRAGSCDFEFCDAVVVCSAVQSFPNVTRLGFLGRQLLLDAAWFSTPPAYPSRDF